MVGVGIHRRVNRARIDPHEAGALIDPLKGDTRTTAGCSHSINKLNSAAKEIARVRQFAPHAIGDLKIQARTTRRDLKSGWQCVFNGDIKRAVGTTAGVLNDDRKLDEIVADYVFQRGVNRRAGQTIGVDGAGKGPARLAWGRKGDPSRRDRCRREDAGRIGRRDHTLGDPQLRFRHRHLGDRRTGGDLVPRLIAFTLLSLVGQQQPVAEGFVRGGHREQDVANG